MILEPADLVSGDLELLGLLPSASNYTFLARLGDKEAGPLVVYKPRKGETPLWDFPTGTLCQREAAAYLVSEAGGFGVVPPTVLRDGPYGQGSVQTFVEHDFECTAFDLLESAAPALRRIVLFDLVVNNADRKAGHVFPDGAGQVWGIDHGICFHAEPKLRTVLWDYAGTPIEPEEQACLTRLAGALGRAGGEATPLAAQLADLLDEQEVRALRRRLRAVRGLAALPQPGPGRNFPWPPI